MSYFFLSFSRISKPLIRSFQFSMARFSFFWRRKCC
jgi:hypothetical protein